MTHLLYSIPKMFCVEIFARGEFGFARAASRKEETDENSETMDHGLSDGCVHSLFHTRDCTGSRDNEDGASQMA